MPEKVDLNYAIGLEPKKAIEYFRAKGHAITWDWHEMWQEAHADAFTVAKVTSTEVLQDIRGAVDQAIAKGQTFAEFRKGLEPTLKAKGWWGKKEATSPDGTTSEVQLGSPHRLRTIYHTNMQTAYMAGRWSEQVDNAEDQPYLMYVAVMDQRTRPEHAALNGKIFPISDPFWQSFYPPNGWGCRCRTRALSQGNISSRGLTVGSTNDGKDLSTREVNVGKDSDGNTVTGNVSVYTDPVTGRKITTDPGWSYNPGASRWSIDADAASKAKTYPPDLQDLLAKQMADVPQRTAAVQAMAERVLATAASRDQEITAGWIDPIITKQLQALGIAQATPVIAVGDTQILQVMAALGTAESVAVILEYSDLPEAISDATTVYLDTDTNELCYPLPLKVRSLNLPKPTITMARVAIASPDPSALTPPVNRVSGIEQVNAVSLKHKPFRIVKGPRKP